MIRRILPALLVLGLFFAPSANAKSGPSLGYYSCYQTVQNTSPVDGSTSYSTTFVDSFTLMAHHRYKVSFVPRDPIPKWSYSHGTVRFHGGPFDDNLNSWHVIGAYHRAGVTMPNSQLPNADQRFTLVLRDTRTDDSDVAPPPNENGATSFFYCRRR